MTHDKDKSGNVMQVAIESDEFVIYIIETDQVAQQLFPYVQRRLRLKGHLIGENEKDNPIIKVSEYRLEV